MIVVHLTQDNYVIEYMCLHSIQTVPHVCILPVASDSMTTEESEGGAHVNCARHRSQAYKSGGVLIGDIMFIQHISRNAFVPHLCRSSAAGKWREYLLRRMYFFKTILSF